MIPPKVILEGDKDEAERLRAFGLSQLRILHTLMTFNNLEQDVRVIAFADGSRVSLTSKFGLDTVTIYVPPAAGVLEEEEEEVLPVTVSPEGSKHGQKAGPATQPDCEDWDIPDITLGTEPIPAIGRDGWGWVRVRGGVPALFEDDITRHYKYYWEISGQGYYIDVLGMLTEETREQNKHKDHITALEFLGWCPNAPFIENKFDCEEAGLLWAYGGGRIRVWTDETVCGPGTVTVKDICGTVAVNTIPYAEALEWGRADPYEIMAAPYTVMKVNHGTPPFHWTIESEHWGFGHDCSLKEAETRYRSINVHSCGIIKCGVDGGARLTCTDDCGTEASGSFVVTGGEVSLSFTAESGSMNCMAGTQVEIEGGVLPIIYTVTGADVSFSVSDPSLVELITDSRKISVYHHNCTNCPGTVIVTATDDCEDVVTIPITIEVGETLVYDAGNPETIAQSGSEAISISGGCPPFRWFVSGGTGLSLAHPETTSRSNTLIASATACGTAHIEVFGSALGDGVAGYVRVTVGVWQLKMDDICVMAGPGDEVFDGGTYWDYEYISGGQKQWERVAQHVHGGISCEDLEDDWSGDPHYLWEYCTDPESQGACDGTGVPCETCLVTPYTLCECVGVAGPHYYCYCVSDLKYYEWECA